VFICFCSTFQLHWRSPEDRQNPETTPPRARQELSYWVLGASHIKLARAPMAYGAGEVLPCGANNSNPGEQGGVRGQWAMGNGERTAVVALLGPLG
jgi:hypothetical protein